MLPQSCNQFGFSVARDVPSERLDAQPFHRHSNHEAVMDVRKETRWTRASNTTKTKLPPDSSWISPVEYIPASVLSHYILASIHPSIRLTFCFATGPFP